MVTVFSVVAVAAFFVQLATYSVAPPAQCIVMFFLLVFTALTWIADVQRTHTPVRNNTHHRIIADNMVFPVAAFGLQYFIAILYFFAWNNSPVSPFTSMRLYLPNGFFVPLTVELVLAALMVVLWVSNIRANRHTANLSVKRDEQLSQKKMLQEQIVLLKACIETSDQTSMDSFRFIEQKVASLPLTPDSATLHMYQEALQLVIQANRNSVKVPSNQLVQIKNTIAQLR
jgi:membrane protein implicated in regulation of membrane protease activity